MITPELDKMRAARDTSQTIGDFIDWLSYNDMRICDYCDYGEGEYHPTRLTIEQLLAKYYEIDLNKVEEERCAILNELRANTNK